MSSQLYSPVPSSEKMPLDLENGTSERDEPIAASESILTTNGDTVENLANNNLEVNDLNANANSNAFSSNQTIESQLTSSTPNNSQLFDTNTTTSEAPLATSPDQVPNTDTLGLSASESAIEQAIEDTFIPSAVPTTVDAPESDLRDATSPSAQVEPPSLTLQEQPEVMAAIPSIFGAPDEPQHPVAEQPDVKMEANTPPAATPDQHDAFENLNIDTSNPTPTNPTSADLPLPQADTKPLIEDNDQSAMQIDQEPNEPRMEESNIGFENTNMADAPSVKVARERDEDDDMEEPSAKRARTDDSLSNNQLDGSAASFTNGDNAPPPQRQETIITEHQKQDLLKMLKNLASRGGGKNFKAPVAELWPDLAAQYSALISNPIDLRTMQEKLIDQAYHTLEDVRADARLLRDNAITFNGPIHDVTKGADETRKSIESKINHLSAPPSGAKKDKKKRPAQSAGGAARAPTTSSRAQSYHSPSNNSYADADADASTSYAVAPGGVPQARRGSVMNRPKREIVPPKNKDLPYSVRPKNKKFATELRFCDDILTELNKPKHLPYVAAFTKPVDPVALGIPSYFQVIKRPMDLSTIGRKLREGSYASAGDFDKDIRLMLANCFKFNPPGNAVHAWGREVESIYDREWSRKDQYMARHAPAAASPRSAQDSDEEDEEEVEEDGVDNAADGEMIEATRARLVEEQAKLISMMSEKVPANLQAMQSQMVDIVKKSLAEAEAAAKKNKVKKPKVSKPVKKAAPIKKQGSTVKKEKKGRYMGTLEKETISGGLGALPDNLTSQVLEWIQNDQGGLAADEEGQFELDIDQISTDVLWRIFDLIEEAAPEIKQGIAADMAQTGRESPKLARPAPKKKNKPMSKFEQDRKLEHLQGALSTFDNKGSRSQEPMPSVERQEPESSGDDSSDSEED